MMGDRFLAGFLLLLRQVVKEEVNQDGVDLSFWLKLDNLSAQLLDSPYATSYAKFSVSLGKSEGVIYLVFAAPTCGLAE